MSYRQKKCDLLTSHLNMKVQTAKSSLLAKISSIVPLFNLKSCFSKRTLLTPPAEFSNSAISSFFAHTLHITQWAKEKIKTSKKKYFVMGKSHKFPEKLTNKKLCYTGTLDIIFRQIKTLIKDHVDFVFWPPLIKGHTIFSYLFNRNTSVHCTNFSNSAYYGIHTTILTPHFFLLFFYD